MKCPKCDGAGEVEVKFQPIYTNKLNYDYPIKPTIERCKTCKGKGSVNRLLFALQIMFGKVY